MPVPKRFDLPVEEVAVKVPCKESITFQRAQTELTMSVLNLAKLGGVWTVKIAYTIPGTRRQEKSAMVYKTQKGRVFISLKLVSTEPEKTIYFT